jgi:hypothetical protein
MLHFNVYRFEKSRQIEKEKKEVRWKSCAAHISVDSQTLAVRWSLDLRENQLKKFEPVTDRPLGRDVISKWEFVSYTSGYKMILTKTSLPYNLLPRGKYSFSQEPRWTRKFGDFSPLKQWFSTFFERGTLCFVLSSRGTLTYEAATLRETRACTRSLPSAVIISSCLWTRRTSVRPHTSTKIWWIITS